MIDRHDLTYGTLALEEALTFTVNFPGAVLAQAERVCQQYLLQQKAQAAYLNALALYAVSFYCDCLDVENHLPNSNSTKLALQVLTGTAELITADGTLICCSVLPGSKACYIPPNIDVNAVGCVVVEVDTDRNQAVLIGFTSAVNEGELPIHQLQPLEALIDRLIVEEEFALSSAPTELNRWFEDSFGRGWQHPKAVLAASHRSSDEGGIIDVGTARLRAKTLAIGVYQLVLVVQIDRISNGLEIAMSVHPILNQVLPVGLKLELLNDRDETDVRMTVSENDNYLSLTFQIDLNEAFSVRITVADQSVKERFIS